MAVRREKVLVEVESDLAPTALRDAAAVALLNRELNSLSGQSVKSARAQRDMVRDTDAMSRSATKADGSINQLTGRLRLFADLAAILGPALAPIGAVGIAGLAGLANQFGVAALAGGTAIIAFQGVGNALKAVNEAALEPTAEKVEAARIALERLSPAAQELVGRLQELRPALDGLRDAAAEGMFPGLIDGINELETRLPELERILSNVSTTLGSMLRDAGQDLASPRWNEFFDFLATDATATLASMGRVVGDLAHGFAELWMAVDPLSDGFSSWMEDIAQGFDSWASGLAQTEGFREFVEYIQSNGPQVADTFVALGNAVLQIVEASAPLGGPVLHGLEAVAKVIAAIADSNLGTPIMTAVGAMALLSRATRIYEGLAATTWGSKAKANILGMSAAIRATSTEQQRATMTAAELERGWGRIGAGVATLGKGAAVLGALTLATTGAADGMGLTNTMTLGLMGTLGGPLGAAVGTGVGLMLDMKRATDDAADSTARFNEALDSGRPAAQRAELESLRDRLNDLTNIKPWEFGKWAEAGGLGAPEIAKIKSQIESLQRALDDTSHPVEGLAGLMAGDLAGSLGMAADQFDLAAMSAQDFAHELAGLAGFLDRREALRNYQKALDDFTKSIKDNGKSFDTSTEKGRNNEAALDAIANSAIQVASHLHGLDRVRTLTQAAGDIKALAKELGIPPKLVQVVIDKLEKAARTDAKPKVEVQGTEESGRKIDGVSKKFAAVDKLAGGPTINAEDHASGPISWVENAIRNLNGDTATVRIIAQRVGNFDLNPFGSADGSTVPGPRQPYRDRIPYLLAPGEEVISNRFGQADRHRALLKTINANRLAVGGSVPGGRAEAYLDLPVVTFARALDAATRATTDHEKATRRDENAAHAHEVAVKLAERAVREHEKALEDAREVVQETRDALRELKDRAKAFGDAVAGNFTDGQWYQANPEAGFLASEALLLSLQNQAASANEFQQLLQQAQSKGLNGGLFNYLAQTGDVGLLQEIAGMTRGQIRQYEQAYQARGQETRELGDYAANQRYGEDMREQTKELRGVRRELEQARDEFKQAKEHLKNIEHKHPKRIGDAVGDALNHAAAGAARRPR